MATSWCAPSARAGSRPNSCRRLRSPLTRGVRINGSRCRRAFRRTSPSPWNPPSWSLRWQTRCSWPAANRRGPDPEPEAPSVAELLNRFGRRIGVLTALEIDYPVGRDGARFQARLASDALEGLDTNRLRFFLVQDESGKRFPAMIDGVVRLPEDGRVTTISGVVVAGG